MMTAANMSVKKMKRIITTAIIVCMMSSCKSVYIAISHPTENFEPYSEAIFVEQAPEGSTYIGTIKVVPSDFFNPRKDNIDNAKAKMLEAAAEKGAKYIVITNIEYPSNEYLGLFGKTVTGPLHLGDGITIKADMYK